MPENKEERHDTYIIPPNFIDTGSIFGGMFKMRNAIEAVVIVRGQKVLKVDKFDYTLHPESRKLKPIKAADYVPEWRSKVAASPNAPRQPNIVPEQTAQQSKQPTAKTVVVDKKSILS